MRVLLVEDNEADADLVRHALRAVHDEAIEVVHVERLTAAAESLAGSRFDVVLLDLSLPDAMGLEGVERVRALAPSAPIVVLTSLIDETANHRALQQGAQDYLQKGEAATTGLLRTIRHALARQQHVERSRLLGEVGAAIGAPSDWQTMIERVVAVLVEDYATICRLDGCQPEGRFDEAVPSRAGHGRAALYSAISDAAIDVADRAALDELRASGMTSAVIVRFAVNGRTDGTLVLARNAGRAPYGAPDQYLAEEIATRLTAALEHAGLLTLARHERERAEAASQLRDDFLATLSHELRTPLSSILGWTQILLAGELPPDRQLKALQVIERNTLSQAALIEDVLDISRIITGRMRLEVRPVSLRTVIAAALETVRPAADAKGVQLAVEPNVDVDAIRGDPDRLQQVLWNLLANAVKFTPRGGKITVRVRRSQSSVEVEVEDTGLGISSEFLPYVFERFRQADSSKARSHNGLGLGLAISRQLVELHGGTIHADSDGAGHGTRFTVRLPVAALYDPAVQSPRGGALLTSSSEGRISLAGLSVLLVDDDPDTLELLRSLFELADSRVETATSAEEAFAALSARLPDVMVSDIGMPGATGYTLIQRVRALPIDKGGQLAAIALTAYARSEDNTEALRAGFNRHVAKPVQPKELLAIVAQLVRDARAA